MAYTIPIPETALHAMLLQQLPAFLESPEVGFASGGVSITGRLRKLGAAIRFILEFEPSASGPDETATVLDWRVRNVRPFLVRWVLRREFRRRGSGAGFEPKQGTIVRVELDAMLEELPAWRRLPASLRAGLRLQHWWMPNDGGGVFLVFTRTGDARAPLAPKPDLRSARAESRLRVDV